MLHGHGGKRIDLARQQGCGPEANHLFAQKLSATVRKTIAQPPRSDTKIRIAG